MTLSEKIALKPKLESIDSSIESCIKIIKQELQKRSKEVSGWDDYTNQLLNGLETLEDDFKIMRDQTR